MNSRRFNAVTYNGPRRSSGATPAPDESPTRWRFRVNLIARDILAAPHPASSLLDYESLARTRSALMDIPSLGMRLVRHGDILEFEDRRIVFYVQAVYGRGAPEHIVDPILD